VTAVRTFATTGTDREAFAGFAFLARLARLVAAASGSLVVLLLCSAVASASSLWQQVSPLPYTAYGLAAATGGDGRVYALGGFVPNTSTSQTAAYTPSSNIWSPIPGFPGVFRDELGAASDRSGLVYIFGGYLQDIGSPVTATADVYDPASNTWQAIASMPEARAGAAGALGSDGDIYAFGGAGPAGGGTPFSTAQAYDPTTGTWHLVKPMPTPRYGAAAVTAGDGKTYVIGGWDHGVVNTVEAYDPATNAWQSRAPMPTPRDWLGAALSADGRIYAVGGLDNSGIGLTTVEVYDPVSNSWRAGPPLGVARGLLGVTVDHNGTIYAIGGLGPCSSGSTCAKNQVETLTTPRH
jgi:N-acetylneuraminic acid mutarotase